ncbi:hypothetical protein [Clostridium magnum]|uniref:Uncharacterized protein n=1 Tax=Clostridium magnum DSM 2767 TaxID=1121326 RepID=A0A162U699_9CLOT|nr:hypothetical protein [Clostridium magnum]KZL93590.1 hypothetical protein CLMAG_06360 [Clostridium magnum DSM 2767]SHI58920.1 hypothetical protein SAMN02745944_04540 [Clostridium magnum DSM 2767]
MEQFKLSFKSSWLYKVNTVEDIKEHKSVTHVGTIKNVGLLRATRIIMQDKYDLADIRNALVHGENDKALEILNSITEIKKYVK